MRLTHESLEAACQALVIHLEDDEIDALIAEAGGTAVEHEELPEGQ